MIVPRPLPFLAIAALCAAPLLAQIDYERAGELYFQDFNHPAAAAAASGLVPWEDNRTFPGWFAAFFRGPDGSYVTPRQMMVTEGRGQSQIGFYLYRGARARHDGALGGQPTDDTAPGIGTGGLCYGIALTNRTGEMLTRFTLSYRVEFWRLATSSALQPTLTASYRVGGPPFGSGQWIDIPGSTYLPPALAPGVVPGDLDGNAPGFVSSFGDLVVTDLRIQPGETLWLRWFDVNNRQADLGIGIDDVALSIEAKASAPRAAEETLAFE